MTSKRASLLLATIEEACQAPPSNQCIIKGAPSLSGKQKYNIPIIGQGGITSANDALEFIIAGAATIWGWNSAFCDPLVCEKINAGISQYLSDQTLVG